MVALPRQTRVLVIGGGPVGLVVSGLLSQRGIANLVVERRNQTQRAPAAHVLRRRPMQVLAGLGVDEEIRRSAPPLELDFITWCATLGGSEVGRIDLHSARGEPVWTNCPQNLLEPILLRSARARPEAAIALGALCLGVEQDADGVSARIRLDDGTQQTVRAAWALAADGAGSPTRRALGIPMSGIGPLARFYMVHFEADLRPWIRGRSGPLFWILNPESPGTLIVHDPQRSHVFMLPKRGDDDSEAGIPARLDAALGVPLTPKILSVDEWSPHVQVAERYREGRVFLVGDAAHRFPPTGGLGLNTGIVEAHDLVERLTAVETGRADAAGLDGYERECRPVAQANADMSFENLKRLGEISRVIGPQPDLAALERRLASLTQQETQQLAKAIEAQRSHFVSDGAELPR